MNLNFLPFIFVRVAIPHASNVIMYHLMQPHHTVDCNYT